MPIAVSCPECGKAYQLPEESLGRKATCKSCGNAFRVQTGADAPQSRRSVSESVSGSKSRISSSDTLPAQIGRFQILDKLGAGAFGTVYKAYDPVLEREVAVKVPNPGLLSSERDKQRYLREPKAAGQLHHPNIVPVFEASLDGDNIFIVSAFIKGRTLEKAIEEKRPDLRRAATLVMKLARALQYAHENGIVHRDVKPANIMLDAKGEPLLMDFGLARIQESAEKLTMNEAVLGTPAYMSPEQAAHNNENVGPASDQYSLGVILFEMLCGQRPFSGPAAIVMSLVIKQEPPAPRSLNKKVPRDLETICLKAMAKEPKKRFADCQEFADDLERWLQDEPITARRTTIVERGIRWSRRNPLVAALTSSVGALLFLVAIISSFAAVRLDQERRRASQKDEEATNQKQLAENNATEAREQARRAEDQAIEVNRQKEIALRERDRAGAESNRAFRNAYISEMNLVQRDWDQNDFVSLRNRLTKTSQKNPDDDDPRGFEWFYWRRLVYGGQQAFIGHNGPVSCVSFSTDGKRIVSGDAHGVIKVWDANTGGEIRTLKHSAEGLSPIISNVEFSPNGSMIASGAVLIPPAQLTFQQRRSGIVTVWDGTTGAEIVSLDRKAKSISSIRFSPDEKRLICGEIELPELKIRAVFPSAPRGAITVWDTATGHQLLDVDLNAVTKIVISSDGQRAASVDPVNAIKVRSLSDDKDESTLIGHNDTLTSVVFNSDGKKIISGSSNGVIKVWDLSTAQETLSIPAHTGVVKCAVFSTNEKHILTGGQDTRVKLWNAFDGRELFTLRGHSGSVNAVAFSPDGRKIVTGSNDNLVKIWKENATQSPLTLVGHSDIRCIAFTPDGKRIVSGSWDRTVKVWDLTTGGNTLTYKGHSDHITALAISADGKTIATGGAENRATLWNLETGEDIFVLQCQMSSAAFSPDGSRIVVGNRDWLGVFDVATGDLCFSIGDKINGVGSVVFSPDGQKILCVAWNGFIELLSATDGKPFISTKGFCTKAVFSASGSQTVCSGRMIEVRDATTLQLNLTIDTECNDAVFSPDGRRIASIGEKGVKFWDVTTGQEVLTLEGGGRCVAFSADGRRVACGGEHGITIWDATDKN